MSVLRWCELEARDGRFLESLTLSEHRPNLLVSCAGAAARSVLPSLDRWCAAPIHRRALPGDLALPPQGRGTMVLEKVEHLTMPQQIELYDWLSSAGPDRPQLVSIAEQPLDPMVQDGRFLEALFYRLNVVRIDARTDAES